MQIKTGHTRIAFIIGNYVIKFPRLYFLFRNIRHIPKSWPQIPLKILLSGGIFTIKEAIYQNKSESRFWYQHRAKFVSPTIYRFLCFNVVKFIDGERPLPGEIREILEKLPKETVGDLSKIDAHCLENTNFIKTGRGNFILVDYGDTGVGHWPVMPFTEFLAKWETELEKILIQN